MAMFNSGIRGKRAKDGVGVISSQEQFVQQESPSLSITSFSIDGTDDLALNPAGGQTVVVHGTGFAPGMTGTLAGAPISAITVVSLTMATFTAPAKSAGSYTLMFSNANNSAAILVPGIIYSSVPTFSTAAGSIGTYYETKPISSSVTATSDTSVTYSLVSGSLPSGATLNTNGTITGTSPVDNASTTYNFSIKATDAELQDVTRSFTLTINTDVVSWVTPSNGTTINLDGTAYSQTLSATDAAGYDVSYSANALPSGLTLSSGTISGTPTVEGTSSTVLTATAATTNRTATNTITWIISLDDSQWKYNTTLLSASAQNTYISDSSINNLQLTIAGSLSAQNFHPYQIGYYGVSFPATGSYLTGSHSWLNITTQTRAWTFECWINPTTAGCIFAIGSGGAYGNSIYVDWGQTTANKFNISQSNGSSAVVNFGTTNTYPPGVWYHLAITRTTSGVATIYVNGVADGTNTYTAGTFATGTTFVVNGSYDNNGLGANGSSKTISNLRFSLDNVVYASNFTPSTSPLTTVKGTILLLCQSNRFIDNAFGHIVTATGTPKITSAHPFTAAYTATTSPTYSYYFNGSSYLTITSTGTLLLGMTWTVEAWIYPLSTGKQHIFNVGGTYCYVESVSGFNLSKWSNGSNGGNYGGYLVANAWNHVVWQCDTDGIVRGFINGIIALQSSGYSINTQSDACIGSGAGQFNYSGYICNLRVLKGTALYNTAGFAVPTAPLTAITNTVLLTGQNSTLVDNSSNNFTLTQTGSVTATDFYPVTVSGYTSNQITTFGSGYFVGSSSYVSLPASPATQLGTDFTVECWINITGTQTTTYGWGIIGTYDGGSNGGWSITVNRTTGGYGLGFVHGNAWQATYTGGYLATNTWYHIAVCRSGSNLRMFINGIQAGSTATYSTADTVSATLYIGSQGLGQYHTGYISDVRIVKGTALYTSNFVPPINSQLTNVTNTQLLTLQSNTNTSNSAFKDSSKFNSVITRNGNATQGAFSPYGDNWSVYFGGNNSYLATVSSSILPSTQSTFTIECWVYLTANASSYGSPFVPGTFGDISGVTNYLSFGPAYSSGAGGNVLAFYWYDSAGKGCSGTGLISLNRWSHIAVSVSANTIKMFIDGVLQTLTGTTTLTGRGGTSGGYQIGAYSYGNNSVTNGYISNLRVVNGTALYSSSFTPSASPLTAVPNTTLLACQSPSVVSNALIATTWTMAGTTSVQKFSPFSSVIVPKYFSAYFNGSTDFLTVPDSTALRIGTSSFTIECWIYKTEAASSQTVFTIGPASASGAGLIFYSPSTRIAFYSGSGTVIFNDPDAFPLDQWVHVAVVRSGTTLTLYVNGTSKASTTWSTSLNPSGGLVSYIGKWIDGTNFIYKGYISNLRVVNGSAVYTTNFTPSTVPLTSVANTQLLTCQSNTFIDNSPNNFAITAGTSTVKLLPVSPFTPTASSSTTYSPSVFGGSMYFDGDSDYLTIPGSELFNLGVSTATPWTVECWVYQLAAKTTNFVSQGAAVWRISIGTDAKVSWVFGGSSVQTATDAIQYNAWNHLAFSYDGTYSGTSNKLFINGILQASQGQFIPPNDSSTTLYIGRNVDGGTAWDTNGYISDVRITKGQCLYKSNFFPPTTPLQQSSNTTLLVTGASGGVIDASRSVDLETVGDAKITNFSPYNGSYYSVSFPSSSSKLGFTQPALGNAFTIEMWVYPTTTPATDQYYYSGGSPTGPLLGYNGTTFSAAHQGSWTVASSVNPTVGKWSHIALVREGTGTNQFKLYVNGTLTGTGTDATTFGVQSGSNIGNNSTSGGAVIGYISNIRITNNQALYTGSFTPSTTPLTTTAVGSTGAGAASSMTGTVLLLSCQSNKFVDNSASPLTLTSSGSPAIQTQNPFQVNTGKSYYFDGTGDYLIGKIQPFGTGDFTIESWFYYNSGFTSNNSLFQINTTGFGGSYTFLFSSYSGNICIGTGVLNAPSIGVATPVNRWAHFALVRYNGVVKFYLDGVMQTGFGTAGSSADTTNYTFTNLIVAGAGASNQLLGGYLSDFRITNMARYTANFTLPTTSLKSK